MRFRWQNIYDTEQKKERCGGRSMCQWSTKSVLGHRQFPYLSVKKIRTNTTLRTATPKLDRLVHHERSNAQTAWLQLVVYGCSEVKCVKHGDSRRGVDMPCVSEGIIIQVWYKNPEEVTKASIGPQSYLIATYYMASCMNMFSASNKDRWFLRAGDDPISIYVTVRLI